MSEKGNWKTTKDAWLAMISIKGIHEVLGYKPERVWILRTRAKKSGLYPKVELMEAHLVKAGWVVRSEKMWERK